MFILPHIGDEIARTWRKNVAKHVWKVLVPIVMADAWAQEGLA